MKPLLGMFSILVSGFYCCLQGILGTINSGKSALVHRYLTGSYMQEESPEGMKCEVVSDSVTVHS